MIIIRSNYPSLPNSHHQSQMHQQMLQSGFSPAVIAAATSALNSSNPQFSQLIQHQLQLQHLQHLQSQFQNNTQNANPDSIKKEPRDVPSSSTNPSPKTITQPQAHVTPSTTPAPTSVASINSQSSSYVPEVEAISPTPEDQKENSNLQAVKDKIINEICKVEKDIASTQYQFDMLEKKQVSY